VASGGIASDNLDAIGNVLDMGETLPAGMGSAIFHGFIYGLCRKETVLACCFSTNKSQLSIYTFVEFGDTVELSSLGAAAWDIIFSPIFFGITLVRKFDSLFASILHYQVFYTNWKKFRGCKANFMQYSYDG
jgi:hypothetical protein